MGGCSAVNCSNSSKHCRLFIFPSDPIRRAKWVQNMRRQNFTPTKGTRLCEHHFEATQFEKARQDGWKKLKQNAVPTLFDEPDKSLKNPINKRCASNKSSTDRFIVPETINPVDDTEIARHIISLLELKASQLSDGTMRNEKFVLAEFCSSIPIPEMESNTNSLEPNNEVKMWKYKYEKLLETVDGLVTEKQLQQIDELEKKNKALKQKLNDANLVCQTFLNEAQIKKMENGTIKEWPNEAIIKGLKLRLTLSVSDYNYLIKRGYPCPSYSTLMRRIQDFKDECGIFDEILNLLPNKVDKKNTTDKLSTNQELDSIGE